MKKRISIVMVLVLFMVSEVAKATTNKQAPIADAGFSRYAAQDPIILDGTGSYDPDNSGLLSYDWQQISGPSVVISDAESATPTISSFVQTDEIQECEFELVVNDGEYDSLPDTVRVVVVPDFGESNLELQNDSFDPNKPTFIYFGGGNCVTGSGIWGNPPWVEKANVINFPTYGPDSGGSPRTYYKYGDMIIVYLSSVAPDYKQPIQTSGWSTGGQPAVDVGIRLNLTYADARYAVNRVTFFDATTYCRENYSESITAFLGSSVDGEQCWADAYVSTTGGGGHQSYPPFHENVLNMWFTTATGGWTQRHELARNWYMNSLKDSDMNNFNYGVIGGAYWSVVGPGKNLQLASTPDAQTYKFNWTGSSGSGYMDYYDEPNHPGRLPEPVTLIGPVDFGDPNGFVLTCLESENAVGYELLFGNDPYRVMDYDIISDTPAPPNDVITTLPNGGIWWTVRVRDLYGSTIYADPKYVSMFAYNPNPADGVMNPFCWVNLSWTEGLSSTSYDVYFGDNLVDVEDGTAEVFQGNQTYTWFSVGSARSAYLVPGTTYFWRIDDVGVDGTVINKGMIWRFTVSH
jgi:hypothetical protein